MDLRPVLRRVVVGVATGALTVTAAWAGTGLAPRPVDEATGHATTAASRAGHATASTVAPVPVEVEGAGTVRVTRAGSEALVGAARRSIVPRPEDYGGTWETDEDACVRTDERLVIALAEEAPGELDHLAHAGSPWPENPDCIYMGGFDIGPANPVTSYDDELGLWVRSVAIGDGEDTVVLTVLDGEGYWWDYASKCDDCGTQQLADDLGAELEIDPSGIIFASTHSHASPDFIGGWGFVPDWYMAQVADTLRDSVRAAVEAMEPAVLEVGEENARPHNQERRDTYRSAEEQQLTWLRAYVPGGAPASRDGAGVPGPHRTIATVGAYAAHPTTAGTNDGVAHPDWPGRFEAAVEARFGGVALHFMTGLGNMSASGGTDMGERLAQLIPGVGEGHPLVDTDVRSTRRVWTQPATNVPLTALGAAGFFDRQFNPGPASIRTGPEADTAPCVSSSAYSVDVPAGAVRIGSDFALTTAPGEIFSNFSNTVKEQSGARVTMPLGQSMDALGYMPQSFEMDEVAQQGLGFFAGGYLFVNYEDSYAIDRCFGDAALEHSIEMLRELS